MSHFIPRMIALPHQLSINTNKSKLTCWGTSCCLHPPPSHWQRCPWSSHWRCLRGSWRRCRGRCRGVESGRTSSTLVLPSQSLALFTDPWPFQCALFFSLNYFETRVHPCLSSTSVHIWSRSSSSSHRLASNKLFGHVWVSLCLPSGTSRVSLLLSLLRCQTRDCSSPHRAQAAAHWKEDGARGATVGEQLSCDANLWPLNGKLCVSTKSSGGTLALWLW